MSDMRTTLHYQRIIIRINGLNPQVIHMRYAQTHNPKISWQNSALPSTFDEPLKGPTSTTCAMHRRTIHGKTLHSQVHLTSL